MAGKPDLETERQTSAVAATHLKLPSIITDKSQMLAWSRSQRLSGKTISLVPTMGFLHHGHLSLIQEAKRHTDVVVVSIYVNPGQFAPTEDLSVYPRDLPGDLQKLAEVGGVDVAFCPETLYYTGSGGYAGAGGSAVSCVEGDGGEAGSGHETWIRVERLEQGMCGRSRPIFFRGVATVVTKLFHIVEPDVAVFGKKDYQQWRVICRMVRDLDFNINVIGTEIVRDADGLATSSRNVFLSPEEREKALSISRSLLLARSAAQRGEISCSQLISSVTSAIAEAGGKLDYAEIVDQESLRPVEVICRPVVFCVAAWFGKVRLIDNLEISI